MTALAALRSLRPTPRNAAILLLASLHPVLVLGLHVHPWETWAIGGYWLGNPFAPPAGLFSVLDAVLTATLVARVAFRIPDPTLDAAFPPEDLVHTPSGFRCSLPTLDRPDAQSAARLGGLLALTALPVLFAALRQAFDLEPAIEALDHQAFGLSNTLFYGAIWFGAYSFASIALHPILRGPQRSQRIQLNGRVLSVGDEDVVLGTATIRCDPERSTLQVGPILLEGQRGALRWVERHITTIEAQGSRDAVPEALHHLVDAP